MSLLYKVGVCVPALHANELGVVGNRHLTLAFYTCATIALLQTLTTL